MNEPHVNSEAERQAAADAGIPIVEASVVLGMKCRLCGPLPYPFPDRLLLTDDANEFMRLHWLDKHGGQPPPGFGFVKDGQHRA
jgi:hypothetical protein